jgi:hypothetical protein
VVGVAAEHIHQWLNDPFMKLHYQFLEWVLPKITRLNELFQRKEGIITKLHICPALVISVLTT